MLEEFFAVTETSVYHVKNEEGGFPLVKKIRLITTSSMPAGERLKGGSMVSIGRQLIMYVPEKYGMSSPLAGFERDIGKINTLYWGGQTSQVVALFLDKNEALACSEEKDLVPCDKRWVEKTKEALAAIGENHPTFEIVRYGDMALECLLEE